MTKEQMAVLFERAATWPEAAQREFIRLIEEVEARHGGIYRLSKAEDEDIGTALAEADRGEFATDEDVHAVFDRLRRS